MYETMMNNDILFFVKFGEQHHMKQLANGEVYFSNAGNFIKQENEQLQKGQRDAFEGRMNILVSNAKIFHPDTNEFICELPNVKLNLGFEFVENMPLFCITAVYKEDCISINDKEFIIKFSEEKENIIRTHFKKATTALVIKQPDSFIENVNQAFNTYCHAETVKYFDTSIMTKDRLIYLSTGRLDNIELSNFGMTTDNIFRQLYCKDIFFILQSEFRFVVPKLQIQKPQIFKIKMEPECKLFTLNEFFNAIKI